jgi:hypothetical protein
MDLSPRAQLALDTILRKPVQGIPSWLIHPMEHTHIERGAGVEPGAYRQAPVETYLAFQKAVGTCAIDQWIPDNPLSMGDRGYEGAERGATTGAERIVCDGIEIDSPEAVVEHIERFAFPWLIQAAQDFDEAAHTAAIIAGDRSIQDLFGPDILKFPYGCASFPALAYFAYGYANYFMAYALYPEVMEKHFSLQADLALRVNRAAARAIVEGDLPPLLRLDHDMTDSRGTLASIESLDRIWLPHFARCLEPLLETDVRLIWHCDGNVTQMVPRLLEAGLHGFQGFQYEDGVDYERICRMKTRDGDELTIIGGVSVTRTLPFGTPDDVRQELAWLVEHGPKTGLFLACTSSMTPGVPWGNLQTLIEGLQYYQTHGRG